MSYICSSPKNLLSSCVKKYKKNVIGEICKKGDGSFVPFQKNEHIVKIKISKKFQRKGDKWMAEDKKMDLTEETARRWIKERGVEIQDIADLVYFLQEKYHENLKMEDCIANVERVISKREVQNAIITGIQLDMLAEKNMLEEPIQSIIKTDESLYGVDEILALSIVNVYGSIGFTNYGYIDKQKPGILARLNDKSTGECHTFLDDIVGAIAAAASSRLAHRAAHVE
jgi:phosphatidylglycerophosphatase A